MDRRREKCKVFKKIPDKCLVWTNDPKRLAEVDKLVEHYAGYLKIQEHIKKTRTKRAKEKPITSIPKGDANC